MQPVKQGMLVVGLFWAVFVPVCIGQTDKVLSGRDLLKAMRGEDIPSVSSLLDRYTKALDSTQSFIASNETESIFSYNSPEYRTRFSGKRYGRRHNRADGQRIYGQNYEWGDINPKLVNLPKDTPHYLLRVNDGKKMY